MNDIQNGIEYICSNNNIMRKIIDNVGECKIGKNEQNIFSYLIGLIIGQKIRFHTARKMRGKLYTEIGSNNFNPQEILNISEVQWQKIGVGKTQKEKILNVANYFYDKNKDVKNINKEDILNLLEIKGIGKWTIITLLIEYGLDLDLFTTLDKHTNNQLKKYFNIEKYKIETFVEIWKPYRSIAFWYLWKNEL